MENQALSSTQNNSDSGADVQAGGRSVRDRIITALRTVYDPEIPVNIYDLGLIYRIDILADGSVDVDMTLTTVGCPVAHIMPGQAQQAIEQVDGVANVSVNLVWDPPWTQDRLSDVARLELGMM